MHEFLCLPSFEVHVRCVISLAKYPQQKLLDHAILT